MTKKNKKKVTKKQRQNDKSTCDKVSSDKRQTVQKTQYLQTHIIVIIVKKNNKFELQDK